MCEYAFLLWVDYLIFIFVSLGVRVEYYTSGSLCTFSFFTYLKGVYVVAGSVALFMCLFILYIVYMYGTIYNIFIRTFKKYNIILTN